MESLTTALAVAIWKARVVRAVKKRAGRPRMAATAPSVGLSLVQFVEVTLHETGGTERPVVALRHFRAERMMADSSEAPANRKARRRWGRNLDGQILRDLPAAQIIQADHGDRNYPSPTIFCVSATHPTLQQQANHYQRFSICRFQE